MHLRPQPSFALVVSLLAGVGSPPATAAPPVERARYLMGTICTVRAFGDPAEVGPVLDAALDRIAALEDAMTTWRPDGGLARLNHAFASAAGPTEVAIGSDLAPALSAALDWARRTGGAFDPTVGALVEAWGLEDGGRVPSAAERAAALSRTSFVLVDVDRDRSVARARVQGIALDLGGFGKGWALDRGAEVLREGGVTAALLDFGGQVLALGAPPGEPGWIVDVASPTERMHAVASLVVRDRSVATSGNAERWFIAGGRRYGHLLDPRTGRPVAWRGSATVVAADATAADVLATALAVGGPDATAGLDGDAAFLMLEPPAIRGGRIRAVVDPDLDLRFSEDVEVRPFPGTEAAGTDGREDMR